MIKGWKEYKLGDLIHIKHGYAFKGDFFVDHETENILLTPGNFKIGGGFKDDKLKYYEGPIPKDYILKYGDVIVTMTDLSKMADTLGFSAKIPNDKNKIYLHNQRIGLVEKKDVDFDIGFLYWLLRFEGYQKFVAGSATGATVKHTSPNKIYAYKFKAPSNTNTQQKIAKILSAYDDLIENNLKRIKLLEEMAQKTYEEWFVRFKFPGHKTAKFNKETGLPEGWCKRKLEFLCSKITDGTHDSPKQVSNGYKLITGKHILDGFINFENAYTISKEDHLSIKKRSGLEKGDILFSNIGTLGNIGVVTEDFEYSCKNVIIFKYKHNYSNFLYTYLSNNSTKQKLSNQSTGVAQKFYSLKFIRNLQDFFPPNKLIEKFDKKTNEIYRAKYNLHNQNQHLKEARDILLPRLMTGMIDVEKIEIN